MSLGFKAAWVVLLSGPVGGIFPLGLLAYDGYVIVKSGIRPSGSATAGLTLGRGGREVYLGIHVLCEERGLVNLKSFGGRRLTESVEGGGPGESRAGTKGHLEGQEA